MSELIVIEYPRNPLKPASPPRRSTEEQMEDAREWMPVLSRYPPNEYVKMALTLEYLRPFGVTLGPNARKRLRSRWGRMGRMEEPLDRMTFLAMQGAVGMDGEDDRRVEIRELIDVLLKPKSDASTESIPDTAGPEVGRHQGLTQNPKP